MKLICATALLVLATGGAAASEAAPGQLENGSFSAMLNGFSIHYEIHGKGPVLMTLPNSWGLSLEGLRAFYRPLEERLTLVYFDPRGMGESGPIRASADMGLAAVRADFEALRVHLGLERVHAIGWSNGAGNLISLAAEHPETLVTAIFLHGLASYSQEDAAAYAQKYPEVVQRFVEFQQTVAAQDMPVEEKTALMKALWLEGFLAAATADPDAAPEMLGKAFENAEFSFPHATYAQQEAPTFDARDRLPLIKARCLVVGGNHDTMPMEKIQQLHAGLGNSKLAVFSQSGHFAPLEEPERFKQIVFEFLGVGSPR